VYLGEAGSSPSMTPLTQGLGFRVSGFGFRIQDLGFRVSGFGFRIWDAVFYTRSPTREAQSPALTAGPWTLSSLNRSRTKASCGAFGRARDHVLRVQNFGLRVREGSGFRC
jgi:hypothetical protein